MDEGLETRGPPDDWPHRHPHLSTIAVAALGGAFIGAALAVSGSTTDTAVLGGAVMAAALVALAEVLSLVLHIPLVPALLSGHPVGEYRLSGGDAPHGAGHEGDWLGGGDGGGGGGGDGG